MRTKEVKTSLNWKGASDSDDEVKEDKITQKEVISGENSADIDGT